MSVFAPEQSEKENYLRIQGRRRQKKKKKSSGPTEFLVCILAGVDPVDTWVLPYLILYQQYLISMLQPSYKLCGGNTSPHLPRGP